VEAEAALVVALSGKMIIDALRHHTAISTSVGGTGSRLVPDLDDVSADNAENRYE